MLADLCLLFWGLFAANIVCAVRAIARTARNPPERFIDAFDVPSLATLSALLLAHLLILSAIKEGLYVA